MIFKYGVVRRGQRCLLRFLYSGPESLIPGPLPGFRLGRSLLFEFLRRDLVILIFPGDLRHQRFPVENRDAFIVFTIVRRFFFSRFRGRYYCFRRFRIPFRCSGIRSFEIRCSGILLFDIRCPGIRSFDVRCLDIRCFDTRCFDVRCLNIRCCLILYFFIRSFGFLCLDILCFGILNLIVRSFRTGFRYFYRSILISGPGRRDIFLPAPGILNLRLFLLPGHLSVKRFLPVRELGKGGFQFQRLEHIFPVAKKGHDLVALRSARRSLSRFQIQLGQFEGPSVPHVVPCHLFQDRDPFVDANVLLLVQLVLKHIAVRISGSYIDVFVVKLQGAHIIAQLELQFTKRKDDLPAIRILGVCKFEDPLAVFVSSIDLIYVADSAERSDILHPAPIHGIRDLSRFPEPALSDQRIDLADRYFKFVFIQLLGPNRYSS